MAKRKHKRPATAGDALELFDARYEIGDLDGALEIADAAVRRHPEEATLHHARGLALWGLGRAESAATSIQRAVEINPAPPEPHLDLATILVEQLGLPDDALRILRDAKRSFKEPGLRASMHTVCGMARMSMGEPRTAEREFLKAQKLVPGDPQIGSVLAEARFDALDLAGADTALTEAMRLDPEWARPHWQRALVLDLRGETAEADREFEEAARLAPEEYFVPERVDEKEFDRRVETAIAKIPGRFRRHLANVEIAVEPYPSEALLREENLSPLILGLFVGTPITERSFDQADLPPRILIFQRNLENFCRDQRELIREIGVTVRHEIGHLMGMDEEGVEDAGHA